MGQLNMRSWERDFLEAYVFGLITGLGVAGLISLVYLRAMFELPIIGEQHGDYWWVTSMLGTTYPPDSSWYFSKSGSTYFLIALAVFAIFIGVILSLATLKDREDAQSSS